MKHLVRLEHVVRLHLQHTDSSHKQLSHSLDLHLFERVLCGQQLEQRLIRILVVLEGGLGVPPQLRVNGDLEVVPHLQSQMRARATQLVPKVLDMLALFSIEIGRLFEHQSLHIAHKVVRQVCVQREQ
eukprot:Lithocolla_globosa_v1_NODE_1852_length_2296_cov_4.472557.p5 type:complete len:128 gc:universal NODE_1852_length_2296_cov_4.472557:669-286(-)